MTQETYLTALLTLLLQAILDDSLPRYGELELLLPFLATSEALHTLHPSFISDALSDWVPRICKGIENAALLVTSQRRRATNQLNQPVSTESLATLGTSFMALMNDSLLTEPAITSALTGAHTTPPRYSVLRINGHIHEKKTGRLLYKVTGACPDAEDTLEPYNHVHHLHVFAEYESLLSKLAQGSSHNANKRHSRALSRYFARQIIEATEVETEVDTDSEESHLGEVLQLALGELPSLSSSLAPLMSLISEEHRSWEADLEAGNWMCTRRFWELDEDLDVDEAGTMMSHYLH